MEKLTYGYRATMAFKLFALEEQAQLQSGQVAYLQQQLQRVPRPFSFRLGYQYAVNAQLGRAAVPSAGSLGGVGGRLRAESASGDHGGLGAMAR